MDEMERSRNRVEALLHGLEGGGRARVECIETHSSWLVLADDEVWKIKKPLDLGFLDYSSLAKRRACCEEEVRLNRRTAPDLYLGVVALTAPAEAPEFDAAGEVLDYAVHMRRFPAPALLATRLEAGQCEAAEIDAVARHVAEFHAAAVQADPAAEWGRFDAVHAPVRQNFVQIREFAAPLEAGVAARLKQVEDWSEAAAVALAGVFEARRAAGRVRECHGDLHLANIVWLDDGPRLFDGIEFNPALRWNDVAADVAFLVMDLQARGRDDLGWRFLNTWLERSGDHNAARVMRYYIVYRAMVRAKVAAIRMAQTEGAAREAAEAECRRYLALAARHAREARPALFIACGVSGSGKSRHGARLLAERGVLRVRADVERRRIAGLALDARSGSEPDTGLYTSEMHEKTYARLAELGEAIVRAGWPVLLDATFLRRDGRDAMRALAARLGVPFFMLAFDAPTEVLRERVARRLAQGTDPSEADVAVLEAQLRTRDPLGEDERAQALEIDTSREVDWGDVLARIDARWPGHAAER